MFKVNNKNTRSSGAANAAWVLKRLDVVPFTLYFPLLYIYNATFEPNIAPNPFSSRPTLGNFSFITAKKNKVFH